MRVSVIGGSLTWQCHLWGWQGTGPYAVPPPAPGDPERQARPSLGPTLCCSRGRQRSEAGLPPVLPSQCTDWPRHSSHASQCSSSWSSSRSQRCHALPSLSGRNPECRAWCPEGHMQSSNAISISASSVGEPWPSRSSESGETCTMLVLLHRTRARRALVRVVMTSPVNELRGGRPCRAAAVGRAIGRGVQHGCAVSLTENQPGWAHLAWRISQVQVRTGLGNYPAPCVLFESGHTHRCGR